MLDKVRSTIEKYEMLAPGDHVVAGVSGGADSVTLLMILLELQQEYSLGLSVVHVNHLLRKEADEEEAYVEALCREHEIPCYRFHKDIERYAKDMLCSTEEAGRRFRYACFQSVACECIEKENAGKVKIAVAHHLNDRVETILFHMARGTGLRGMQGIPPVRQDGDSGVQIIRPLYEVSREEIEDYLQKRKLRYYIDATNAENDYSRNRIRNLVLPELLTVNAQAVSHIAMLSERSVEYWNYVEQQAVEYEQKYGCEAVWDLKEINKLPELVKRHLVFRQLIRVSGHEKDWEEKHVQMVLQLMEMGTGKRVELPYGVCVWKEYDTLRFEVQEPVACSDDDSGAGDIKRIKEPYLCHILDSAPLPVSGSIEIEGVGSFCSQVIPMSGEVKISKKVYTKMFDYDIIKDTLCLRNPLPNDYIVINKEGSRKRLSRYLMDEKVPRALREKIIVVADGSHVIWIPGLRISEALKLQQGTTKVLVIEYKK